jgi:hypothetical protein
LLVSFTVSEKSFCLGRFQFGPNVVSASGVIYKHFAVTIAPLIFWMTGKSLSSASNGLDLSLALFELPGELN